MSNLYIHNGNSWCDVCSNTAKIKVPSGDWIRLGRGTGNHKYYNGSEWVPLECCYEVILAPPIPEVPEIESRIELGGYTTPFTLQVMNFMEDPAYIPTCQEIKNVGCIDGDYGDSYAYEESASKYRANRDMFLKAMNENALSEHSGSKLYIPLNYQQWLPGELSDKLLYQKGNLMRYHAVEGCPECTHSIWHSYYYYMLNQATELLIENPGMNLKDGVYNNVEFSHVYGTSNKIGLYLTANITVSGGVATHIDIVRKGSGYTVDEIISPLPGEIAESCETTMLPEVAIGEQTWMVENLNVTTYSNGDIIPEVQDPIEWANLTTGAWCHYNNDPSTEAVYGKLYNWYALNDPRGITPVGWHVPTIGEWVYLINHLGYYADAGGYMKEASTNYWNSPNTGATNSSGFTALPGGYRSNNGNFIDIGNTGNWWSYTETDSTNAKFYHLNYNSAGAESDTQDKKHGMSVRLVKGTQLPLFRVSAIKMNRLVDILPTVNQSIKLLDGYAEIAETGVAGEKFSNGAAWDPIMNIWNVYLGDAMEDIQETNREKRNAERKALNQLNLAHAPFLSANEYFINHRWRNEVI